MASVDDLRAVFQGVFEYDRETASGELKKINADGDPRVQPHYVVIQRGYTGKDPMRLVISIPAKDAEGDWSAVRDHYAATWEKSELGEETILAMPELEANDDLDSLIDPNAPNYDQTEFKRMKTVLGTLRGVAFTYNTDFDRVFLDVSKGASAFGLRIASYFPQSFAGLIVRHPIDVTEEMRFGSLRGMPVLLLADGDTKAAADKIAAKLNEMEQGSATVIEAEGAQGKIDEWVRGQKRQLMRSTVVVEPNHDKFNDAYWVFSGRVAPLASLASDDKPRLEVSADRASNRIEVTAKHIEDFTLLLNDELVDLSKPFTVVINGKATKEERLRDRNLLLDGILSRRDPSYIFTAKFGARVPEDESGGER